MNFRVGNEVKVKSNGNTGIVEEVLLNNVGDQNCRVKFADHDDLLGYGEWELDLVPRDFHKIFRKIKNLIPVSRHCFIEDMDWVIEDASYKPPEDDLPWRRCFDALQKNIEIPREDWEIKIWSIFSEIPEDEIKEQIKQSETAS